MTVPHVRTLRSGGKVEKEHLASALFIAHIIKRQVGGKHKGCLGSLV